MPASLDRQIELLKIHGITFDLVSEAEARSFLQDNTYFFKLKGYRANYHGIPDAAGIRYEGLDFGHLLELSKIDFALSRLCLGMCMSVEHAVKVRLNQHMMAASNQQVIAEATAQFLHKNGHRVQSGPYTQALYDAKKPDFAPWHLWELMTFSDQLKFYGVLLDALGINSSDRHMLLIVHKLRNAVSHGNCLLTDVTRPIPRRMCRYSSDTQVSTAARWIANAGRLSKNKRKNSFNRSLQHLVVHNYAALLFCYLNYVNSPGMLKHAVQEVQAFTERTARNKDLYLGDAPHSEGAPAPERPRNEKILATLNSLIQLSDGFVEKATRKLNSEDTQGLDTLDSQTPLIHFLLVYDHEQGRLSETTTYDDGVEATLAYLEMERKHRSRKNIEIVLIGSDSIETIQQTHSNYFGYEVVTDPLLKELF